MERGRILLSLAALLTVSSGTLTLAKGAIYVDQWGPTRSELMIADANGKNPRKLVPGLQIDYNASFSFDGEWVVFTSERDGSADIFRVRTDGMPRTESSPAPCGPAPAPIVTLTNRASKGRDVIGTQAPAFSRKRR